MNSEREIILRLHEASFESGGSKYNSSFGRYSKDGDPITREDYFKAKGNDEKTSSDVEALSWEGGYPWDDDLFFKNVDSLGLESGSDDLQVGDKKLNFDYAILDKPVKFYHATLPDNVEGILSNGLSNRKQGKDGKKHVTAVYLSGSKEGISKWRGNDTVVLEVILPAGTKVYQDRQSNAVFVLEGIPKENINIA